MENSEKYNLNIQTSVAEVYEQYTRYSYTEEYALAEFIDNSTASFYENEKKLKDDHVDVLFININYDDVAKKLVIRDEAYGMDKDEFDDALIAGRKPKKTWRNEFGYGLKTAATWFGRHWSVTTSQLGSSKKYYGYIDLDELKETNSNEIPITVSDERPEEHYTEIVIEKLNRQLSGKKIKNKIIEVLNSMYRRDLVSGKIEIMYNGTTLEFKEYEPLTYKGQTYKKNISFNFVALDKEYHVHGFVGILEQGSFKKGGFALLRANRVIVNEYKPKEIFVQAQNPISKNLYGELYMEDFKVNQAKDGIAWVSPEVEEKFIENLKKAVVDYLPIAKMSIGDREKNEKEYQLLKNNMNSDNYFSGQINDNEKEINKKSEVQINNNDNVNKELHKDNDNNSNTQYSSRTLPLDSQFLIKMKDKEYVVKWEQIPTVYSLFKFNKDENILIVNTNHPYAEQCNVNSRLDISKLLLGFNLAELNAQKIVDDRGLVNPSMIRNSLNNLLN